MLSPDSNLLHDSQLVPKVAAFDQALLAYVPPDVKQAYEQRRDEILRYWQSHKENPAGGDQSAPSGT